MVFNNSHTDKRYQTNTTSTHCCMNQNMSLVAETLVEAQEQISADEHYYQHYFNYYIEILNS